MALVLLCCGGLHQATIQSLSTRCCVCLISQKEHTGQRSLVAWVASLRVQLWLHTHRAAGVEFLKCLCNCFLERRNNEKEQRHCSFAAYDHNLALRTTHLASIVFEAAFLHEDCQILTVTNSVNHQVKAVHKANLSFCRVKDLIFIHCYILHWDRQLTKS